MDRNADTFCKVYTFLSSPNRAKNRPDGDEGGAVKSAFQTSGLSAICAQNRQNPRSPEKYRIATSLAVMFCVNIPNVPKSEAHSPQPPSGARL
jgi:hypothetical protein